MLKYSQKANRGDHITRKIDRVLAHGETRFQEYLFFESAIHGTCMALDGDLQSCASDEALYHEALVHPAPKTCSFWEASTARLPVRYSVTPE
jgi:spermidine synthase